MTPLRSPGTFTIPEFNRAFAIPDVSQKRVIRTIGGLRPFRESGFRVERERLGPKTVVHNYGHGGAGVTLSWGTAELAVRLGFSSETTQYAVLGCGAVGLSTARLLQERGASVTIYAKELPPNTTSNIAGAQWYPFDLWDKGKDTPAFQTQFAAAARLAYEYFQTLIGPRYGIYWIDNYSLGHSPDEIEETSLVIQGTLQRLFPEGELRRHPAGFCGFEYSVHFLALQIEMPIYLRALIQDFLVAGGKIIVRDFVSRNELQTLPETVLFNCTGLGAGKLFNDPEVHPIKGQLTFLLPQPEIDYNLVAGPLYMFPRQDGILLGGTYERGNDNRDPDPKKESEFVSSHQNLFANHPKT